MKCTNEIIPFKDFLIIFDGVLFSVYQNNKLTARFRIGLDNELYLINIFQRIIIIDLKEIYRFLKN